MSDLATALNASVARAAAKRSAQYLLVRVLSVRATAFSFLDIRAR
jgi:hypothetical protein